MHRKIKQGMFLIASLLLTSVLTATGIVLVKITTSGKKISDNSIQKTQLLTATTMSNSIISASIDNILKANSTANIFLVDTSTGTGSRTIVKNPDPSITPINLCSLIFNKSTCDTLGTGPTNPITLVPAAQQHGNFSISQSGPTITTPAPNAYYNVVVQSLICGSGSNTGCQKSDLRITKKRSCPSSTNVPPKPMSAVAMLDTDVIPADYNNKFPTGNVMKNSIKEIWESKILNERREMHMSKNKKKISLCENCNVWDEVAGEELVSQEFADKVSIKNT